MPRKTPKRPPARKPVRPKPSAPAQPPAVDPAALAATADPIGELLAQIGPGGVRELVARAQAGDESVRPMLTHLFDEPSATDIYGDLGRRAEAVMVLAATGNDLMRQHGTARKLAELTRELTPPDPTPAERLVVQMARTAWVHRYAVEQRCANALAAGLIGPLVSYERALTLADKRFRMAIKMLADLRRAARPPVPAVKVVAGQQVNFIGTGWASPPAVGGT